MKFDAVYTRIAKQVLEEHSQVFDKQDLDGFEKFIDVIQHHQRIFVMGVGREGIAARGFAMRLMHLGKEVHWIWDDTTPGISADDLFVAVNGSGNIGHINYVLEAARRTEAHILVVTGSPSGKASSLATSTLFVPASVYNGCDPVVPSVQPMGNLFEQHLFMLFDIAEIILESRLKLSHEEMSARHRNVE